jgi:hypothetical protein
MTSHRVGSDLIDERGARPMSEQPSVGKNTQETDLRRKVRDLQGQKQGMLPFLWVMLALFLVVISLFVPLAQPFLIGLLWFVALIVIYIAATGWAKNRKLDKEIAEIEAQLNSLTKKPDLSKQD